MGVLAAASMQTADQWEKAVVLHLGRYSGLRGPGVFIIVPLVDTVACWIDLRTITTSFRAEKTLARDTVPVDVETVLFWRVRDPERAAPARNTMEGNGEGRGAAAGDEKPRPPVVGGPGAP